MENRSRRLIGRRRRIDDGKICSLNCCWDYNAAYCLNTRSIIRYKACDIINYLLRMRAFAEVPEYFNRSILELHQKLYCPFYLYFTFISCLRWSNYCAFLHSILIPKMSCNNALMCIAVSHSRNFSCCQDFACYRCRFYTACRPPPTHISGLPYELFKKWSFERGGAGGKREETHKRNRIDMGKMKRTPCYLPYK